MSSHASPDDQRPAGRKPLTLHRLREMHAAGEKIAMLTVYDSSFAGLLDEAGVDCLLVGDSLGMVLQGQPSTLPVTLEEIAYHTRCVARGNRSAWLIADMPFGSYQASREQALASAVALMQAGAQMVKIEGGGWSAETVRFLVERGIPVCAHLGLTPQSVHALGGYRIQGREESAAGTLRRHAGELADAGAAMLVLELVPAALAAEISTLYPQLMTIGIGAGPQCAGQVLVLHDMLNITRGKLPRFVRNFMADASSIDDAIRTYVRDVKNGRFPDPQLHTY
ncbi:3-methyl-2-oxobutanoate hydroxymethyltransferase [Aquabacterium sp. A7-Y]|uniref:3-methyl-2-oxobutanoate hydroxymethyltransferase n=1 Tax=Aquabacterium sp. A7-Y TaxID=1349605 RepID=UPI00223DCC3E|nr:3-methyl-2-oxobutanoate hydroxymethyltransferase [Aquabacterium sp. A7-Y]MCW7538760.1 3-methyl-2-oxobutanoate hydroxymethyltransferase [Aquabacterium sp. A7-Y]